MVNTEMEICIFIQKIGGGVRGGVSQANDSLGIVEFHIH